MKPKILLLLTGGTISQVIDKETHALVPAKTIGDLLTLAPELNDFFSLETIVVENLDSSNIQPHHWVKIAETIQENYSSFDGFVVTHGTDSMSYTASAVSYLLQNLGKPVVFTGTQLPPSVLGSDARTNLIHAFQVAAMDIAEVLIVFGTKVLRANRTSKQSESTLNAFWSPIYFDLGEIKTEIELFGNHKKRTDTLKPIIKGSFMHEIVVITVTPGLNPKYIDTLIASGIKGLILEGFGAGNLPIQENSLLASIKRGIESNIPIVIASQCASGIVKLFIYETGLMAEKSGAISAKDMTLEAVTTKLMWILSQTTDIAEIKKMLYQDIAGEITI